jgi:hypothetical protein
VLELRRVGQSMKSAVAMVSVVFVACDEDPLGPDGLNATVDLSPAQIVAGESVSIDITISNESSRTYLIESPWPCRDVFLVVAPDGRIMRHNERICLAIHSPTAVTIGPRERIVFARKWSGNGNDFTILPAGPIWLRQASMSTTQVSFPAVPCPC